MCMSMSMSAAVKHRQTMKLEINGTSLAERKLLDAIAHQWAAWEKWANLHRR